MIGVIEKLNHLFRWSRFDSHQKTIFYVLTLLIALTVLDMNRYYLWSDEAGTADFAVNLLKTGHLSAWDGHNLITYNGGENLDYNLENQEFTLLQFYVAASSIWLFGQSTWSARLPFWLLGLITPYFLWLWSKQFFGKLLPPILPPLLLTSSVIYQLFIPQCRYYSLILFFYTMILWTIILLEDPLKQKIGYWIGILSALGLVFSNPMIAASIVVSLCLFLLHSRFQTKQHFIFIGLCGIIVFDILLYDYVKTDSFYSKKVSSYEISFVFTLFYRYFRSIGLNEFLPYCLLPALFLPFFSERLKKYREMSILSLYLCVMIILIITVIAFLSPENTHILHIPDNSIRIQDASIRYVIPILILGLTIAAVCLTFIERQFGSFFATIIFLGLIFSNSLYYPFLLDPKTPHHCYLCEKISEYWSFHPSGGESYLEAVSSLPANSYVNVRPDYMATILIFYRPDLTIVNLLDYEKDINPKRRSTLPPYIFKTSSYSDYLVWNADYREKAAGLNQSLTYLNKVYGLNKINPHFYSEWTFPQLTRRLFQIDKSYDEKYGVIVYKVLSES